MRADLENKLRRRMESKIMAKNFSVLNLMKQSYECLIALNNHSHQSGKTKNSARQELL